MNTHTNKELTHWVTPSQGMLGKNTGMYTGFGQPGSGCLTLRGSQLRPRNTLGAPRTLLTCKEGMTTHKNREDILEALAMLCLTLGWPGCCGPQQGGLVQPAEGRDKCKGAERNYIREAFVDYRSERKTSPLLGAELPWPSAGHIRLQHTLKRKLATLLLPRAMGCQT